MPQHRRSPGPIGANRWIEVELKPRADAQTRTGDPFIRSVDPVSQPPVARSRMAPTNPRERASLGMRSTAWRLARGAPVGASPSRARPPGRVRSSPRDRRRGRADTASLAISRAQLTAWLVPPAAKILVDLPALPIGAEQSADP